VTIPKTTMANDVMQLASKVRGPNKTKQIGLHWIAMASARRDADLESRSRLITQNTLAALSRAFPEFDPELIGDIVADLDSLWDTGQQLNDELKRLFKMRFPKHRQHLREFLAFISAIQLDMAEFWIRNLRKKVPKLLKELDRQERGETRMASNRRSREPVGARATFVKKRSQKHP
jgi:hypothetical protein